MAPFTCSLKIWSGRGNSGWKTNQLLLDLLESFAQKNPGEEVSDNGQTSGKHVHCRSIKTLHQRKREREREREICTACAATWSGKLLLTRLFHLISSGAVFTSLIKDSDEVRIALSVSDTTHRQRTQRP